MHSLYDYFLVYNDERNLEYNVQIVSRPSIVAPQEIFTATKIPQGGTIYKSDGFSDRQVTVDMNFQSVNPSSFENQWRKIKKWLLSHNNGRGILKFSDDLEAFYRVSTVTIVSSTRELKRTGRFTVVFTISAYTYLVGEEEQEIVSGIPIYNRFITCEPIYRIEGNGEFTFKVNGKDIKVTVSTEGLTIDTERGLCFRGTAMSNTSLGGVYEDLYLKEGENTFEWTATGFKIFIQPNWRCL